MLIYRALADNQNKIMEGIKDTESVEGLEILREKIKAKISELLESNPIVALYALSNEVAKSGGRDLGHYLDSSHPDIKVYSASLTMLAGLEKAIGFGRLKKLADDQ